MHILSIQSQVVFGHVGNSAIAFPLQTLGHDVWSVPTAILSNHAGYPDYGGRMIPVADVADLLDGLRRRGALSRCDLMLSGYLGHPEMAVLVSETVAQIRTANPALIYCCDPVMGDRDGGLYVDPALPGRFADELVSAADIACPNLFEAEMLCGYAPGTLSGAPLEDIVAAGRKILGRMRPGAVLMITGVEHRVLDSAHVAALAVDEAAAWCVETPRLDFPSEPHGAGDLASGLFAAAVAGGADPAAALESGVAAVFAVLSETQRHSAAELELVLSRDAIQAPTQKFVARRVG